MTYLITLTEEHEIVSFNNYQILFSISLPNFSNSFVWFQFFIGVLISNVFEIIFTNVYNDVIMMISVAVFLLHYLFICRKGYTFFLNLILLSLEGKY